MASIPSRDTVFETTELLESILFQLPTRDLLLGQRVSKRWQAVIGISRKLQRALFLEPVKGEPLIFEEEQD